MALKGKDSYENSHQSASVPALDPRLGTVQPDRRRHAPRRHRARRRRPRRVLRRQRRRVLRLRAVGAAAGRRGVPDARPQSQRFGRRRLGALRRRHAAAGRWYCTQRLHRPGAIRPASAGRQRRRGDLASRRNLARAVDVAGHQRGRHSDTRRDATARLVRTHVVRHDPEGPPLHRCCRQLVAVLGVGRQRSARTGNHGRCLLPAARPDAHSPGTGKRRHSVRTAARSSSSFPVLE